MTLRTVLKESQKDQTEQSDIPASPQAENVTAKAPKKGKKKLLDLDAPQQQGDVSKPKAGDQKRKGNSAKEDAAKSVNPAGSPQPENLPSAPALKKARTKADVKNQLRISNTERSSAAVDHSLGCKLNYSLPAEAETSHAGSRVDSEPAKRDTVKDLKFSEDLKSEKANANLAEAKPAQSIKEGKPLDDEGVTIKTKLSVVDERISQPSDVAAAGQSLGAGGSIPRLPRKSAPPVLTKEVNMASPAVTERESSRRELRLRSRSRGRNDASRGREDKDSKQMRAVKEEKELASGTAPVSKNSRRSRWSDLSTSAAPPVSAPSAPADVSVSKRRDALARSPSSVRLALSTSNSSSTRSMTSATSTETTVSRPSAATCTTTTVSTASTATLPPVPALSDFIIPRTEPRKRQQIEELQETLKGTIKKCKMLQASRLRDRLGEGDPINKEGSFIKPYLRGWNVYDDLGRVIPEPRAPQDIPLLEEDFSAKGKQDHGSRWWGVRLTDWDRVSQTNSRI